MGAFRRALGLALLLALPVTGLRVRPWRSNGGGVSRRRGTESGDRWPGGGDDLLRELLPEIPELDFPVTRARPPPQRPSGAALDDTMPSSDLAAPERRIWIVTTASLPWMTGTAVNPLLRAAHLTSSRRGDGKITLMVPFLDRKDQKRVFPGGRVFEDEAAQEAYLRTWLRDTADLKSAAETLDIRWYPARYHPDYGSIFPMGDIIQLVPDAEADICVLEEPEHLNW
mmetsp:Transcript_711/g.1759  ORF Transcript_711/g.1759 Transcript_711/m.1759 type:complete len:227 (-) Transcript_711:409-1089(-)